MSAVMQPQRTAATSRTGGRRIRGRAQTLGHDAGQPPTTDGAPPASGAVLDAVNVATDARDARESLSRLSLSPSPTLIFEVDAHGTGEHPTPARRWDVRLVGSVRNRGHEAKAAGEAASSEVSAVLIIRAMTPPALLATVRAMTRGGASVPPEMISQLHPRTVDADGAQPEELTVRERAVLQMLADGHSTREIAEELSYSERTVKNVVHDVLEKLDCRTRAHAVAIATRHGVI